MPPDVAPNHQVHAAPPRTVLLTGATGFVGRAAYDAMTAAGWAVRCMTRDAGRAARQWPGRTWVSADVADEAATTRALEGCDRACYFVHGMAGGGAAFRQTEVAQATAFRRAAERTGVRRIVYLGGVAPAHDPSEHLRSRLEVGDTLRAGSVSTVELRASMIIGYGSLSWLIVRDLAARLPLMVLPRWLKSRTQPIAIDDIVAALLGALDLPLPGSACFDVPGPEVLSGRDILERTAAALGLRAPIMIEVPVLSPKLSSHWVRFVTRADWTVAREVVLGLEHDLLATDDRFWALIGHRDRLPFADAARRAIAEEQRHGRISGPWGLVERVMKTMAEGRP
jgi:uncharacterized protein YbjT (DUF2867 family)